MCHCVEARCAEARVGTRYLQNWRSELAGLYRGHLDSRPGAKRAQLVEIVFRTTRDRDTSEPDRAACGSGIEALKKAMEAGRCGADPNPPSEVGNYVLCEGGEFAELVSDPEWRPRRDAVREAFYESLAEPGAAGPRQR